MEHLPAFCASGRLMLLRGPILPALSWPCSAPVTSSGRLVASRKAVLLMEQSSTRVNFTWTHGVSLAVFFSDDAGRMLYCMGTQGCLPHAPACSPHPPAVPWRMYLLHEQLLFTPGRNASGWIELSLGLHWDHAAVTVALPVLRGTVGTPLQYQGFSDLLKVTQVVCDRDKS